MTLRALKLVLPPGSDEPFATHFESIAASAMVQRESSALPSVFLVLTSDLPTLRQLGDAVIDRGRKPERKALSHRLLGQRRVPIIEGSFSTPGQLLRSVRTLLKKAVKSRDANAYLIGIDAGLFDAVSERAATSVDVNPSTSAGAGALLGLLGSDRIKVPASLVRRFVGESPEVMLVRQSVMQATRHAEPVLVLGDTGTGKEIVARSIHDFDPRRYREAFVAVNCGAVTPSLFESELFGYASGAFTDARREGKQGLWPSAGDGTLFLDEVGDLSLTNQVKILRALQEGEGLPVGGLKPVRLEARVIAATNRDLAGMVEVGTFREDLYYRLRPFMIRTPALRDHAEDIPMLAQHFWREITKGDGSRLPPAVLQVIGRYSWPGNARELRAVLVGLNAWFGGNVRLEHLRAVLQLQGHAAFGESSFAASDEARVHRLECLRHLRRVDDAVRACKVMLKPLSARSTDETVTRRMMVGLRDRLSELKILCGHALLFHSEATFAVVHQLSGRLVYLQEALDRDTSEARGFWKKDLSDSLNQALARILKEVERLLGKI